VRIWHELAETQKSSEKISEAELFIQQSYNLQGNGANKFVVRADARRNIRKNLLM